MAMTVLLVEDHPEVREITAFMLEDAGYDVICANDGDEARQAVAGRDDIDVVITDLHLPHGASGIDMGMALREGGLKCPMLVVSGALTPDQTSEHDWIDYLPKPFNREALLQKIMALGAGQ